MNRLMNSSLFYMTAMVIGVASISVSAQTAPRMQISSQNTFVGEPLALNLEIENAKSKKAPEFPQIDGLTIESTGAPRQQRMTTIVNGQKIERKSFNFSYQITANKQGNFNVPSITVETETGALTTQSFSISAKPSLTGDLLFAEVQTQDATVFVGQSVNLKLKIWLKPYHNDKYDLTISAEDMFRLFKETTNWGPFKETIEKILKSDLPLRSHEVFRDSPDGEKQSYYLFEIPANYYPTREGKIDLAGVNLAFRYPTKLAPSRDPFDRFFQNSPFAGSPFQDDSFKPFGDSPFGNTLSISETRPISTAPNVDPIDVQPIPQKGRPADYRGAVGDYRMVTQASPLRVKSGDPITLKIGIQGTGPMELVQSPPLNNIPALVKHFKVSDEPLAGVVEGDIKVFTTTIRPRTAGLSEIPAIPFSFFNPATAEFVSVQSSAIPIVVDKAEQLALDSIVGVLGTSGKTESQTTGPKLNLNNVHDVNLQSSQAQHPGLSAGWVFLIIPPLGLGLFIGIRKMQSRRRIPSSRATLKNIANAKYSYEVSKQCLRWIENRIDRRRDTLTRTEAIELLSLKIDEATNDQLDSLLRNCENAAFNGDDPCSLISKKQNAVHLINKIKAQIPCFSLEPRVQRLRQIASVVPLTLVLILGTILLIKLISPAPAIPSPSITNADTSFANPSLTNLNSSQKLEIFKTANRDYDRGVEIQSQDTAEAASAFSNAAEKYQLLIDSGIHNSDLFCNLGNAYLQRNDLGYAIANYQKSLRCNPLNQQASQNIQVVLASNNPEEASLPALKATMIWISGLPSSVGISILILGWCVMCVATAIKISTHSFTVKYVFTAAVLLLLIGSGMTKVSNMAHPSAEIAVALASEISVFQGSSESTPPIMDSAIVEGESVRILQRRGKWSKIESESGIRGWVQSEFLEKV